MVIALPRWLHAQSEKCVLAFESACSKRKEVDKRFVCIIHFNITKYNQFVEHCADSMIQVNIPKTRRTYCKGRDCRKHTMHKVTQYKAGKVGNE